MEIRGERECKSCGNQWSYYETGSVSCPECGSMRSVGVGERAVHTASQDPLDVTAHQTTIADQSIRAAAPDLKSDLRDYVRSLGYIHGGELLPLDDTSLVAHELLHAVDVFARSNRPTDDEELYVLTLLRGANEGTRPTPNEVPSSMAEARGLAYANAVERYRRNLSTWLDSHPDKEARRTVESLATHVKRAEALEGALSLDESEALVAAANGLHSYLTDDDLDALADARDRLERLS
ncbi:hypothetical protein ACFQJC_00420 [Haloferax namakaokahaiae]|uniref:TFIIB-type zinc ribbon-containing protein n=1 Tax=Haloferax namakaokahaiae TaxID=1748331 RepID=A0ABD5Z9M4_9EURY